jgi:hypothetical protein
MHPEGSLPATNPYPEPDKASSQRDINILLSILSLSPKHVLSLHTGLFTSGCHVCAILFSPMHAKRHTHLIVLDLLINYTKLLIIRHSSSSLYTQRAAHLSGTRHEYDIYGVMVSKQ